jgi:hypothetical protein
MCAVVGVQVPVIEALKLLVHVRAQQQRWRGYDKLGPDEQSYALMEEFLFWVAVLHR